MVSKYKYINIKINTNILIYLKRNIPEIGTHSWLGLVFLKVFYADILVYLNISFHFSNSRHGCPGAPVRPMQKNHHEIFR